MSKETKETSTRPSSSESSESKTPGIKEVLAAGAVETAPAEAAIAKERASRPVKVRIECTCRATSFTVENNIEFVKMPDGSREAVTRGNRYRCRGCSRLWDESLLKDLIERTV